MLLPHREGSVLVHSERNGPETRKGASAVALVAEYAHVLGTRLMSSTDVDRRW